MNKYTQPSTAVREYQRISHLVDRRIAERPDLDTKRFWLAQLQERATEIAEANGLTIFELVDQWEAWTEAVEAERELVRQRKASIGKHQNTYTVDGEVWGVRI
jgi:hypothetical protein